MKKKRPKKVIKTRDYNMVNIIKGATKAGVHKDRKKEANKYSARTKVPSADNCMQCGFSYDRSYSRDENEIAAMDCGYCSVSCMDYSSESQDE